MSDKYQTPPPVCKYMVDLIPFNCFSILEPTPGDGNIVKELESRTTLYKPVCEELGSLFRRFNVTYPIDFFLLEPNERFDAIVMNPPFSSKSANLVNADPSLDLKGMKVGYHMLEECMKRSDHVIALMPWFTISDSDVRLRALIEYGLKSVTLLPRKTFEYARIQTVVLELHKGWSEPMEFKYLDAKKWIQKKN